MENVIWRFAREQQSHETAARFPSRITRESTLFEFNYAPQEPTSGPKSYVFAIRPRGRNLIFLTVRCVLHGRPQINDNAANSSPRVHI